MGHTRLRSDEETVWIFHGDGAQFAAAVFTSGATFAVGGAERQIGLRSNASATNLLA